MFSRVADLAGLPAGTGGRVVAVEVPPGDRERLEVMGLCHGREVQVVRGGDPMIVRVLGTRIGIAAALARGVRVETGADVPGPGEAPPGETA
ncbi:MAG TPA: FeoA family protein [Vicinamibacteria bacterium]|nr:FeoA family protein [Vicinamibacteria bacterium]